jgi:uncharacterized protein (TIGR03435 family)
MAELATNFAGFRAVSRPVHDKTGIREKFDFQIEFAPTFPQGANQDPASSVDAAGASFFTVIQEQLGLKLQSTKARLDFVVIDSAEHPTDN